MFMLCRLTIDPVPDFEPPAKQRKIVEPTIIKRPASAQSMARPSQISGQIRPPARTAYGISSKLGASTTSYRNPVTQNVGRPLSQSVSQGGRGHSRSKSHVSGKQPTGTGVEQNGIGQTQNGANGRPPISISSYVEYNSPKRARTASVGLLYGSVSSKPQVAQRSFTDPSRYINQPLFAVPETQNERFEDMSFGCPSPAKKLKMEHINQATHHVSPQSLFSSIRKTRHKGSVCTKIPRLSPIKQKHELDLKSPSQTSVASKSP